MTHIASSVKGQDKYKLIKFPSNIPDGVKDLQAFTGSTLFKKYWNFCSNGHFKGDETMEEVETAFAGFSKQQI